MLYVFKNISKQDVYRVNTWFLANKETTIALQPGTSQFLQVKACAKLRLVRIINDKEVKGLEKEIKTGNIKDTEVLDKVVVKAPKPEIKTVTKDIPNSTLENKTVPVDTKSGSEDNKDELEIKEDSISEDGSLPCPYCDFTGTQMGLYHHVRIKHPDSYEAYKGTVQK